MTVSSGPVSEAVRTFTPLGVAFHDLVSDSRIVDGLRVDARPLAGGRVTRAFQTKSGGYAFRGLDGMRSVEFPESDSVKIDSPPVGSDFLVAVVDLRDRFVATVLRVTAPTHGLLSQAGVLSSHSLAWGDSLPDSDLPIYLFSSPSRALPSHVAAVRGQLIEATGGQPAAFCRVEVIVNPGQPGRRRYVGVADSTGAVLVPVAYPRFGTVGGSVASPPAAGTRGDAPANRSWPVEIRVRYEPERLSHHPELPAPTLDSVFSQDEALVWPTREGPPHTSLHAQLRYGADLVLRTDGESHVLVGGSPS